MALLANRLPAELAPHNGWVWKRRFPDRQDCYEYFSADERKYLLSLLPQPKTGQSALTGLRDRLSSGDTILIARRAHASIGGSDPLRGFDPTYKAPRQSDDPSLFIARWLPSIACVGLSVVAFILGLLVRF